MIGKRLLQKAATQEKILGVAMTEFSDKGYHGARLGNIARCAGVSQGLINRYYHGKEGLYFELFKKFILPWISMIPSDGSLLDILTKLVSSIKACVLDKEADIGFLFSGFSSIDFIPPAIKDAMREAFVETRAAELLRQHFLRAGIENAEAFDAFRAFMISVISMTKLYVESGIPLPSDESYVGFIVNETALDAGDHWARDMKKLDSCAGSGAEGAGSASSGIHNTYSDSYNIIEFLSKEYECINFVRSSPCAMADETAANCWMSAEFAAMVPGWAGETNVHNKIELLIKHMVYPADAEEFRAETRRSVIFSALKKKSVHNVYFRSLVNKKLHNYLLRFISKKNGKEPDSFIFVIVNTDLISRQEHYIADQNAIIVNLSRDYDFICALNSETMEVKIYHVANWIKERFSAIEEIVSSEITRAKYLKPYIHPDDYEMFMKQSEHSVVVMNVKKHGIYSVNYRTIINGAETYYQTRYTLDSIDGKRLIIGLRNIDEHIRTELEKRELEFLREEKKLSESLAKTEAIAFTDALTGVGNAAAYAQKIRELQRKMIGSGDLEFAIVICDLNNLKSINDSYGHDVGNRYLVRCCKFMCEVFKHSPVYRVGGDEFLIVLETDDYINREERMRALQGRVLDEISSGGSVIDTISFASGIAVYNPEIDNRYENIFIRADMKMYENKSALKRYQFAR